MMIEKHQQSLISTGLGILLLSFGLSHPAVGQATLTQQQTRVGQKQVKQVSLSHLYWHFLAYQNHLDTKAADNSSKGKDGTGMRKLMQQGLGFRDEDFAPIRISSVRLSAEIKALDAKAAAIRADGPSASNQKKMMALTAERESDISSEISYLKRTLSPAQVRAFEAFLVKLFSPSNAISQLPHPNGQPPVPAVQK